MISTLRDIRLLQQPDATIRQDLKTALQYACSTFAVYRDLFESVGIESGTMDECDPLAVLERLPVTAADVLVMVSAEGLSAVDQIVDMETSSGTTGVRKKRFISYEDDRNDHELMAELFRVAGITTNDRAACLDTDPAYLMVSFARALDLLGAEEAYSYSVGRDRGQTLNALVRLDPTVIFAVPSMFERCWTRLRRLYDSAGLRSLRKVVFLGERVPHQLRTALESECGIEVFSYYGAAETSSLGIECTAHTGIHLFTDRNLFELCPSDREGSDGQLVVTSLVQRTVPLVRYALGDEIDVLPGECPCGLPYPRVDVLGRTGDGFSILGSRFYYDSILRSVYRTFAEIGYMQLVLTDGSHDVLSVLLPDGMRTHAPRVQSSLLSEQLELEFLVASKLASLRFTYVDESYFTSSRKMKLVDDRREKDRA